MDKLVGYIKVYRSLVDSFLWSGEQFSRGQAWIDLNILAFYKDQEMISEGKKIKVERGCVYKSIKYLAERWGWSRSKVTRFLDLLVKEDWISYETYNKGTKICILNYETNTEYNSTNRQKTLTDHSPNYRKNNTERNNKRTTNTSEKRAEYSVQTAEEIEEAENWFEQLQDT